MEEGVLIAHADASGLAPSRSGASRTTTSYPGWEHRKCGTLRFYKVENNVAGD